VGRFVAVETATMVDGLPSTCGGRVLDLPLLFMTANCAAAFCRGWNHGDGWRFAKHLWRAGFRPAPLFMTANCAAAFRRGWNRDDGWRFAKHLWQAGLRPAPTDPLHVSGDRRYRGKVKRAGRMPALQGSGAAVFAKIGSVEE